LPLPAKNKTKKPEQLLRIAIDTGGTFTDCVWIDPSNRHLRILKLFSTPADPSVAIAEAIKKISSDTNVLLMHGTTVGTNALLQRKGGRQARPKLYDFFFDAIEPLVSQEMRFGVAERTDKTGNILCEPSAEELSRLAEKIRAKAPDAIAISLLFSFVNPENEQNLTRELQRLGIPLSVSHQILPEFREYERASTVVVNAYLQPVMAKYLNNVSARLSREKQRAQVFVMQSSGGLTSLETAAREPVRTVLSGPAGGVVGAAAMAGRSGYARIIGFDMGGTSTDVCLVEGIPTTTNEAEVAGLPVRVPMLNIHTVGAGGGSLARFDAGGALRVGPESAGAEPGPICYGRGTQPTVTDANLLLGRLPAKRFLGGEFELDLERTRRLTGEWLKKSGSRLPLLQFAEGVVRVVNANMEKAIRVVSIEKGYDTRDFSLVAFGGAGAMHACELAAALEIPRVIVPAMPGALSALGILMSDVVKDYSRTLLIYSNDSLPLARLTPELKTLQARAVQDFQAEGWPGKVQFEARLDMRYRGQGFEISVPHGGKAMDQFHSEHQRRYGYSRKGTDVEIVTLRLRAWIATAAPKITSPTRPKGAKSNFGKVMLEARMQEARIAERASLVPGRKHSGPAIVTEYSGTTVVPPEWSFGIDRAENLILEKEKQAT
jgi:N-methylhydantoinase A